MNKKLLYFIDF